MLWQKWILLTDITVKLNSKGHVVLKIEKKHEIEKFVDVKQMSYKCVHKLPILYFLQLKQHLIKIAILFIIKTVKCIAAGCIKLGYYLKS